ncbi:MAG: 2-oxoacid:ferredoxin oxidoreductase subunit gamma [Armatimonadetes bacterium]|nr:2-oxoacid:ferredoxin oxidoreductase subunit gamma [Armatimonadota bacterium]
MRTDVIFAGIGGQGLMTMGQILASAALSEGKQASYLPSYSPEVRGGWANCTVVISENSIGSPTVGEPSVLVALERTSLAKHGPTVKPGGLILLNASLIPEPLQRDDVRLIGVPATEIADELGNPHVVNSVMLGAYVAATEAVTLGSVADAVREQLRSRFHLIDVNMTALRSGADFVASHTPEVV